MSELLPDASQVCAIVVGIERFAGLGPIFTARGAVAGALSFARWLVHARGVPPAQVHLWLLDEAGGDAAARVEAAGLSGCVRNLFTGDAFWHAMVQPPAEFKPARFLCVYFCGHGVVGGDHNDQFLVLPEATAQQFQCLDSVNWRELFRSSGWENFGHQLWITDACRNSFGDAMKPLPRRWSLAAIAPIRRCSLFACAVGETAAIDPTEGPRFTRELLAQLPTQPEQPWPDFEAALCVAAAVLRSHADSPQSPAMTPAEGWNGLPLTAGGESLARLIEGAQMDPADLLRLMKAAMPLHGPPLPQDWRTALSLLEGLPPVNGLPPAWDFAERVARTRALPPLRDWLDSRLTDQQCTELAARLLRTPCRLRLQLWYREDLQPPLLEAELKVIEAGPGVKPWACSPGRPAPAASLPEAIGAWLRTAYEAVPLEATDVEIEVELYLPRTLLGDTACDIAAVPLGGGDESRLGRDVSALLRCTDRYKGPRKLHNLKRHAPAILARLHQLGGPAARWALAGEAEELWSRALTAAHADAPVWLAFDPAVVGGQRPLDVALVEGLPAVLWLRVKGEAAAAAACAPLLFEPLLAGPPDGLPQRLRDWRRLQLEPASTVALLLDDPDPRRLPSLLSDWAQPGA